MLGMKVQGAIYQKESTLSDQPILLRRLAKFGPMEPQSGIFLTILSSGNTVATTTCDTVQKS